MRHTHSMILATAIAVAWSCAIVFADSMLLSGIWQQSRTASWPATDGVVRSSRVVLDRRGDSRHWVVEIEYDYVAGGYSLTGNRITHSPMARTDKPEAEAFVRRFPAGRRTTVYYDPDDARDAVLVTGLDGKDYSGLVMIVPFNLATIGLWWWVGGFWWRRFTRRDAGGVRLESRGERTFVRLPDGPALAQAAGTALAVSIACGGALMVIFGGTPPLSAVVVAAVIALGVPVAVLVRHKHATGSGATDLIIDREARLLSLPATFGRSGHVTVPFDAVTSVEVRRLERYDSEGGEWYEFAPTLEWTGDDGSPVQETLAEWSDEARAEAFAAWLTGHVLRAA